MKFKNLLTVLLVILILWLPFAFEIGKFIKNSSIEFILAISVFLVPFIIVFFLGLIWKKGYFEVLFGSLLGIFLLMVLSLIQPNKELMNNYPVFVDMLSGLLLTSFLFLVIFAIGVFLGKRLSRKSKTHS